MYAVIAPFAVPLLSDLNQQQMVKGGPVTGDWTAVVSDCEVPLKS